MANIHASTEMLKLQGASRGRAARAPDGAYTWPPGFEVLAARRRVAGAPAVTARPRCAPARPPTDRWEGEDMGLRGGMQGPGGDTGSTEWVEVWSTAHQRKYWVRRTTDPDGVTSFTNEWDDPHA
eukprot:5457813-Alexandrium_andersonii.AAC.1